MPKEGKAYSPKSADRLSALRKELGVFWQALADRVGLSRSAFLALFPIVKEFSETNMILKAFETDMDDTNDFPSCNNEERLR